MTYAELHAHSCYSLLDGASRPEDLVARAAALGLPALALTDHDAVYGAVRFSRAAREAGIHPVLGAELTIGRPGDPAAEHLTLLAEDNTGWHNLCYLISRARHAAPKGEAALPPEELVGTTAGLIALSGCRRGGVARALLRGDRPGALQAARRYRDLFGTGNFFVELQRHFLPGEEALVARLSALAGYLGLETVVTNNVHYAAPDRARLQDVLVAIAERRTLDEGILRDPAATARKPNSEYYVKSAAEMAALFPDRQRALANSVRLAQRCRAELRYGLQDLPVFPTPHGMATGAYLRRRCLAGLHELGLSDTGRYRAQLDHELTIIEQAGLANYFLIVGDLVAHAQEQGIRCQGRGSAANSLVAYLLRISPVDPLRHDLVFERFLSAERQVVPDIDIDFDAARREAVIQYVYERYGDAHTAMACTFVTFRSRSALRDIGQALGLSADVIRSAVRALDEPGGDDNPAPLAPAVCRLLTLSEQIEGFPRHLGIHSGGMIITGPPLMGRVPTEPARMEGRVVVQWDKEALEDAGLVKIDLLGLRMLSVLSDAVDLVEQSGGERPDLRRLPVDDPAVYAMIGAADTMGVFQVESRAQTQMLPRLQPRCYEDLIVAISLIRPGPIQGNMVHPYLRRRAGEEPVSYAHPSLEPALRETLGVILFQEQVLKVARDLAGFTPGQGEQLRRALGAKRAEEKIAALRDAFLAGAGKQGVAPGVAAEVFRQLQAFGGYSFAKSHAAAFAVIVYQSAWLKKYHFVPFYTALLNNQPMGFWNPAVLVNYARRQGVDVQGVDVNRSGARCAVENGSIRLGFNYVKGVGEPAGGRLVAARKTSPYADLRDFCRRTLLPRRLVENLIAAGGMDSWGIARRQLLWELGQLQYDEAALPLTFVPAAADLPALSEVGAALLEQEIMGLSTGDHVMVQFRAALNNQGVATTAGVRRLANGRRVRLAGLLVVHQAPPTAKGFRFLTLEDEFGLLDVVVRPRVYEKYHTPIHAGPLLLVDGIVERQGDVVGVLAVRVRVLGAG